MRSQVNTTLISFVQGKRNAGFLCSLYFQSYSFMLMNAGLEFS